MIPILQQAQGAYLAKVNPRLQPVVQKLVTAGHQIMFSPKTRHLMQQQLQAGPQNPEVIGAGIAKLVGLLYHESKGTAPVPALIPAGILLLFDGLQFLSEAGAVQVTPPFLAKCTQATTSAMLQMLGVKPEQVQAAINQARQKMGGAPAAQAPPAGAVGAAGAGAAMPPAPPPAGIVGAARGT